MISQSKDYIDGYYNDNEKVINDIPVILFGDHTKVVKYISEPFIPGADGTKLIKAKCHSKYLYYLILYGSQNIDNRGYARHFAYLKDYEVPYFSNAEVQCEISSVLDYLYNRFENIEIQNTEINILKKNIKNKILESVFSDNSSYKSYYENEFALGDILPYEQPAPYIVESTEYSDTYETPVLTPGKTFILGYTNEKNGIYKIGNKKKVIIFDDFTTASRLVDFDFKVKSSAMKILSSVENNKFDIEYMYYLLQTIKINANTHKRFWISEYAPIKLKIHTYKEQLEIVKIINQSFSFLFAI